MHATCAHVVRRLRFEVRAVDCLAMRAACMASQQRELQLPSMHMVVLDLRKTSAAWHSHVQVTAADEGTGSAQNTAKDR